MCSKFAQTRQQKYGRNGKNRWKGDQQMRRKTTDIILVTVTFFKTVLLGESIFHSCTLKLEQPKLYQNATLSLSALRF